eukprot:1156815-Pelagomonas_calceolata.AAC.3
MELASLPGLRAELGKDKSNPDAYIALRGSPHIVACKVMYARAFQEAGLCSICPVPTALLLTCLRGPEDADTALKSTEC